MTSFRVCRSGNGFCAWGGNSRWEQCATKIHLIPETAAPDGSRLSTLLRGHILSPYLRYLGSMIECDRFLSILIHPSCKMITIRMVTRNSITGGFISGGADCQQTLGTNQNCFLVLELFPLNAITTRILESQIYGGYRTQVETPLK